MKVLLDPYIFNIQRKGGISKYYTELYRFFKKDKSISYILPLIYSENIYLRFYNYHNNILENLTFSGMFRVKSILKSLNLLYTRFLLKCMSHDLFVPTYYSDYYSKCLTQKPYVLTVYDMIHELMPHYFKTNDISNNKKLLIYGSKKIIAISNSTKNDIIKIYPDINPDKIQVVYLAHSIIRPNIDFSYNLINSKFILFVGDRAGYKNFKWFINAVSNWMIINNYNLVCLGGNNFDSDEVELLKKHDIFEKTQQYSFKDDEAYFFYSKAFAFIFPSEYEGFGLPVLESMHNSCPVILPFSSSFPEVAGDAGVYYELNNKVDFLNCLNKILNNNKLRNDYIVKGLLQSKKFSWEKTAINTKKVYYEAIQ
jgi:glycosyltransferase involved in cell wall biosynthesis